MASIFETTPHGKRRFKSKWKSPLLEGVAKRSRTKCTSASKLSSKKPKPSSKRQFFLDLGQKIFDREECKLCGMSYAPGVLTDEQEHKKFCKNNSGLFNFGCTSKMRQVGSLSLKETATLTILRLDSKDNKLTLKKLLRFKTEKVDKELGFECEENESWNPNFVAFVAVDAKRSKALGCAMVQRIEEAGRLSCDGEMFVSSSQQEKAILGIRQIWVEEDFRRQGIARELIKCARNFFIDGFPVPNEHVAFSVPTRQGFSFASSIMKREDFLIYNL
mmetsp:Transcript_11391/g.13053  ORF Transcript_11391/g.13053 Transcript_11391/m.13053 type:complete len:275 (+) Transcript_11391:133-957(+)